ncbi:TRAP transporter substrate-binding protein [Eisenibacter elegans]|jgi:TRAP-type mannitol/chloroaromatic compound transport system substrate-binding protein|uniref:TRAP transporter substrate-binding protein n=1 Tax=Eisenibacter elegans TaxID=997 RepID=UPI000405F793|nr:twin-arginine translocation signal domain-containing protein [Eisenibacter elegans]
MNEPSRRRFIRQTALSGAALAAAGLGACQSNSSPAEKQVNIQTSDKKYQWRMVTTWPPKFPVLGEGLELLSQWVREASGGRLEIKVYGGGELVPILECFDAVSQGAAQMASGVSYYWAGKAPAAQFFAAIPFGLNAQQMNAWLINGGGLALWEELYANFNLIPFPGGNTGMQMGGWFRKEIKTAADLKGLKMRIPGLGGKVLAKAGGTAVLSPATELYTNLERGIIDATEWIGPYHDYLMGFYNVAKYYYYPGWHETGPTLEVFVNKKQMEALPLDLQAILRAAIYRLNLWTLGEFEAKNNFYLNKLIREEGVQLRAYPKPVLDTLYTHTQTVLEELTSKDPFSKKVYASLERFRQDIRPWSEITEKVFYNQIQR